MDDNHLAPTARSAALRLTIAICGGAMLGGSLAALLGLVAISLGYSETIPRIAIWAVIGAILGALQAGSHVGLHLHREWCEATIPHDHEH